MSFRRHLNLSALCCLLFLYCQVVTVFSAIQYIRIDLNPTPKYEINPNYDQKKAIRVLNLAELYLVNLKVDGVDRTLNELITLPLNAAKIYATSFISKANDWKDNMCMLCTVPGYVPTSPNPSSCQTSYVKKTVENLYDSDPTTHYSSDYSDENPAIYICLGDPTKVRYDVLQITNRVDTYPDGSIGRFYPGWGYSEVSRY